MLFAVLPLVAKIAGSRLGNRSVTTPSTAPDDRKASQSGAGVLDIMYESKLTKEGSQWPECLPML